MSDKAKEYFKKELVDSRYGKWKAELYIIIKDNRHSVPIEHVYEVMQSYADANKKEYLNEMLNKALVGKGRIRGGVDSNKIADFINSMVDTPQDIQKVIDDNFDKMI